MHTVMTQHNDEFPRYILFTKWRYCWLILLYEGQKKELNYRIIDQKANSRNLKC